MNEADKIEIIKRYESRLAEYGHDVRTLASGSDVKQRLRYRTLLDIGISSGDKILDLGCGFGDFFGFIRNEGIDVEYVGYDIVPGLLEEARKAYPAARFELRDIQEKPPAETFDWVTSSQAFNNRLKYEDNADMVRDVIKIAFDACLKGMVIDMMSSYVDFREERLYYFDPAEMFTFAKGLAKRVVLRHDYLPHEFCLYLQKNSPI
jgi:SAM-dependent methyltransferase